jgi:hypothetical protein
MGVRRSRLAPAMRPPRQKRTAFPQEHIVLKRMPAIGLCFGELFQTDPQHARTEPQKAGQEALIEVATYGTSPNRFRAVRAVFIASHALRFVDPRGLFISLERPRSQAWFIGVETKWDACVSCGSVTNHGSRNFQTPDASMGKPSDFAKCFQSPAAV